MNRPRLRWMLDRGQAPRELVGRHSGFARKYGDTISISRRRKRIDQPPMRAVAIDLSQRVISNISFRSDLGRDRQRAIGWLVGPRPSQIEGVFVVVHEIFKPRA